MYESDLQRRPANYVPLTPLSFLARSARVYPSRKAVVYGEKWHDFRTLYGRCRQLASALRGAGVGTGDTVSVLAPNIPAMLEAHFAVPMTGAVLNTINTRLDAAAAAFILTHGEARVLLVDSELGGLAADALSRMQGPPPLVVAIDDELSGGGGEIEAVGEIEYEEFRSRGCGDFAWEPPEEEWQAISLNYTSGTTGNPKGVVYHHRGAYLNALGNVMALQMNPRTVYLWTLPMFHCNGWCHPWALVAAGATQVCLRKTEPAAIFDAIARNKVTHLCGAPVVLNMLIHAPDRVKRRFDHEVLIASGGASPPSAVISSMAGMGFRVHHLYGLTETYGPATLCAWQEDWNDLDETSQAARIARQGVAMPTLEEVRVCDPESLEKVPADAATIGEIMVRGNTVMKGYLKNPEASAAAFAGGWFHSGDLGVVHEDGYVEVKDRSKDIIISGGENISTLEVEEVLYRHPAVMEAAVVARPDQRWGETPCAFVALAPSADPVTAEELIRYCRDNLAHFKAPKTVVFGELPKTSTGKIQKFLLRARAAGLQDPNS